MQYDDTYDTDDDAFCIHLLEIQMMIVQYSHTEDVDDDGLDDDVRIWWFKIDVLMKSLSQVKFEHFWDKLGVVRKDLPWKGK